MRKNKTVRTLLTSDTTFKVAPSGGDWPTLQQAMDGIADSIDIGGFVVTVNVAAGSFAGFGIRSTVGGGIIQFVGSGVSATTITHGPNVPPFNDGPCVSCYVPCASRIAFNQMLLDGTTFGNPSTPTMVIFESCVVMLGTSVFGPNNVMSVNAPAGANGAAFNVGGTGAKIINNCQTLNVNSLGGPVYSVTYGGQFLGQGSIINITGNPKWASACARATRLGLITNSETVNGTATGKRFDVESNAVIDTFAGGPNNFPGDVAGTVSNGGMYL